jgi:hypothetical protein
MRKLMRVVVATAAAAFSAAVAKPAHAVITHPGDDATITTISAPPANAIGRWSTNASAVAINPNYILTTRHQGGGVGTSVVFGGTTYEVAEVINVGTADLRIARITTVGGGAPANLSTFTPLYTGSDAAPLTFTLGGFGRGRGAALTATTGGTYGYQWAAEGNTNLRFGRNVIDGSGVATDDPPGFVSDVLVADFDGPGAPTAIQFEGIITEFDSGSGWFVENGSGNWQVAAISRGVGHSTANQSEAFDRALFASNLNGGIASPDGMDAVRLSSYSGFINSSVPEPTGAALVGLLGAGALLRRRRSL